MRENILLKTIISPILFQKFRENQFTKLFDERRVNNIYLDSRDFSAVSDNIDGLSNREKVKLDGMETHFRYLKKL